MMGQNDMLQIRLDQNYQDYVAGLRGKTADELIALAPEITAAQQLRDELACACSEEDAATLLQLDDPLKAVLCFWMEEQDKTHGEKIGNMIWHLQQRGKFITLKAPESSVKHTPPRLKRGQER